MSLENQINEDIKSAMLAKDKERLNALRAVKSALLLQKTEKGGGEITEDTETKILQKMVKQRKDSAALYKAQGREDLAAEELTQLEVISRYLPEPLSDEEITRILKTLIAENQINGMKDMGKLMGLATKALGGKAENRKVSEIVKQLLA